MAPSSSTEGFFQELPSLPPQFTCPDCLPSQSASTAIAVKTSDDRVFARILALYLPPSAFPVTQHLHDFSRRVLQPSVLVHSVDAETNHPVLRPLTTFGEENKNDPLWTTAGWQALKEIGYREGVVAVAYEKENKGWNRRIQEFALGHVWTPAATMTGCPMSMTDGAATLLSRHLDDPDTDQPGRADVFREAYRRLISRDPNFAWTSGQWMTERTGGSDVSGTETFARKLTREDMAQKSALTHDHDSVGMPLGPWLIDGFKWFSSATDSEMAVLLARTAKGGLSAFYVPMRRKIGRANQSVDSPGEEMPRTELNGIRIQRLKNKLGTKSLPTAELELNGTRGWLIGEEGKGVKEISAILNITRLHTAAGSVANWARGLAVCRAYTKVRKVRGSLLQNNPQHLRWMADETVKYWAGAHFAFFGVALQGAMEQDWNQMVRSTKAEKLIPEDKAVVSTLLRLLTPVMKAQVSVSSVDGLRECMECIGGVGYCENNEDGGLMNIAKTFRDNLVNPIWEGTVSVMAEDIVRVLIDKRLGNGDVLNNVFAPWVRTVLATCEAKSTSKEGSMIYDRLESLLTLVRGAGKDKLLYYGREILNHIEAIVCACLLVYDSTTDEDTVAAAVASRWIRCRSPGTRERRTENADLRKEALLNKAIFLGADVLRKQTMEKL
ncbi:uncharacterized protein BDR25DRAFT_345508 [Lindgomyces ingoldianus]|uniref:Uncharacterized protein n=1 Tax=Lindgomyces ingoldianus TaxID=673940 RepID=A0ACB6QH54_9PLEO|nr:uncharacterized protein BDR25DRAFT_345508 [Lindgomyces ingoldianus]KAF2466215.1 hypothetical protein BDR25DRAFT_345508 [Lindgomyces ingoldianus]